MWYRDCRIGKKCPKIPIMCFGDFSFKIIPEYAINLNRTVTGNEKCYTNFIFTIKRDPLTSLDLPVLRLVVMNE